MPRAAMPETPRVRLRPARCAPVRLRIEIAGLGQERRLAADADSFRQRARKQFRLVVTAAPHLGAMHRHGDDGVEVEIAALPQHALDQLRQRIGEEIVSFEFERMQHPLQRSRIAAPGLGPIYGQRFFQTRPADEIGIVAAPRQRAEAAFRRRNGRQRRPAGRAARRRPFPPRQLAPAGHARRMQNDSRRLPSY